MSTSPSVRASVQPSSDIVSLMKRHVACADVRSAELEMTVNMLIQIDKLVQLLESPVFTCKILFRTVSYFQ
jgi:hypothetical protein